MNNNEFNNFSSQQNNKQITGFDPQTGQPIYANQNNHIIGYDLQTGQSIYKPIKKEKFKKIGIYGLFSFIFSVILPFILIFIIALISIPMQKIGNIPNTIYRNIYLILVVLFIMNEYFISIITKKIVKNGQNISNIAFWFALIKSIICALLIYLLGIDIAYNLNDYNQFAATIILIGVFKLISYLIATKFALKEKIKLKNIYIFVGYILLLIIILNLILPTSLNKILYSKQFSSIQLRNELVDNYNNNSKNNCESIKNVKYTHKFTDEELKCFTDLKLSSKFTTNDIQKFINLEKLEIENIDFDNEINFNKNEKLVDLDIKNSKFLKFDSNMMSNVRELSLVNVIIDNNNLNITNSNISNLYIDNIKINNLSTINNLQLESIEIINSEIKDFMFDNNPKIEITDGLYNSYLSIYDELSLEYMPYTLYVDKVENINFRNVNDMKLMLFTSNVTFKSMNFDNKRIYIENDEYLISKGNIVTTDSYFGKHYIKTDNLTIKDIEGTGIAEIYDNENMLLKIK